MQSCTRQPFVKKDKCSSVNFLGHWANSCFSCSCFTIWTGAIHHIRLEISWARHYSIEVKYENQRQAFCKYRARDWNWESYWFRLCGHASWIRPTWLIWLPSFSKRQNSIPAFWNCSSIQLLSFHILVHSPFCFQLYQLSAYIYTKGIMVTVLGESYSSQV